jgi:diguanylate cyclase (GGDEF)-like protein
MKLDNTQANILVVDDTLENLRLLIKILTEQGFEVRPANSGAAALAAIEAEKPDLVLLDIEMPGMKGFEVCERIKADPDTRDIPVLFLSALDQVFDKVKAFELGGADYITKPFHIEEVLARVNAHLSIRSLVRTLERQNAVLSFEISTRKEYEAQLKKIAITDPLTKINNRRFFFELAEKELDRARRHKLPLAVILFDIDHFKQVNDTHGHLVGDQVLISLAETCKTTLRNIDIFARYGGEEFIVLMPETDLVEAEIVAQRIRSEIEASNIKSEFLTKNTSLTITISLGVTCFTGESELTVPVLVQRADIALYQSKKQGRNRVTVWSETDSSG